jgi:hypothetical protein
MPSIWSQFTRVPTSVVHLRQEPARNNQKRGVRLAADYEFSAWSMAALLELAIESRRFSQEAAA